MRRIKKYGIFIEVVDGEIMAYDVDAQSGNPDFSTVGILREADEDLYSCIAEALDTDDLSQYNVECIREGVISPL